SKPSTTLDVYRNVFRVGNGAPNPELPASLRVRVRPSLPPEALVHQAFVRRWERFAPTARSSAPAWLAPLSPEPFSSAPLGRGRDLVRGSESRWRQGRRHGRGQCRGWWVCEAGGACAGAWPLGRVRGGDVRAAGAR